MKCYTFRYSKLRRSYIQGAELLENGTFALRAQKAPCYICLPPLDGAKEAAKWGRLQVKAELPKDSILSVYAFASDSQDEITECLLGEEPKETAENGENKIIFFGEHGIGPFTNRENMLLYELCGRYLWLALKITHGGSGSIKQIRVSDPGDNFMQTFPEVYQERNSEFHRYLSVFSTIYNDFQEETEKTKELFLLGSAPDWILPQIGELTGISTGEGILPVPKLKKLLEHAARYVHYKGTAKVMRELTELFIGEVPLLIEKEDGNVTFLLERKLEEEEEMWLLYFLNQFKPVYSRLNLISYEEEDGIDRYCFTDINAKIQCLMPGSLDNDAASEQCVME